MLSHDCRYPFFIPPMGLVGTVHPDGELAFARASARCGIHYCVSTATSKLHEEIMQCFISEQKSVAANSNSAIPPANLFFQLYVHSRVDVTVNLLRRIRALGYDGLFITVDTPVIGKRTADRRLAAREMLEASPAENSTDSPEEVEAGRVPPGVLSQTLSWDDLAWIRKEWRGKMVIKGVQSGEDVRLAAQHGVDGVYLSNHGGRQLQYAPSSLDTLLDIHETCPDVLRRVEVYVDGGFSTGADILKALCLGARAVGIGRPFLYAAAAYGESGVVRAINCELQDVRSESFCQRRRSVLIIYISASRGNPDNHAVARRDERGSVGSKTTATTAITFPNEILAKLSVISWRISVPISYHYYFIFSSRFLPDSLKRQSTCY